MGRADPTRPAFGDDVLRSAVRCARSAPAATLEDASAVAGVRLNALERTLMALPGRGPCAAMMAAASPPGVSLEVRPLIVQDRVCPPSMLRVWSSQSIKTTRMACAAASGTAAWQARDAADPAAAPIRDRSAGADHAHTPRSDSVSPERAHGCVPAVLWRLAHQPDRRVTAHTVASNPQCPPDLLAALAVGANSYAAHAVAANPASPPALLARVTAAQHSNISQWHSRPRGSRNSGWTPDALASNPSCGPDVLTLLASHPDWNIRANVASNPSCPQPLRRQMTKDPDQRTSQAAIMAGPAISYKLIKRMKAPYRPHRSFTRRRTLSWSQGHPVSTIMAVVSNPSCPPQILASIIDDDKAADVTVIAAAANPACPPAARNKLTGFNPALLMSRVANITQLIPRVVAAGAVDTPQRRVARLTNHPDPAVAATAAANPRCPPKTLLHLIHDRRWEIRAAAAANPSLDPAAVLQVSADPHPGVRRSAETSLRQRAA